MTLKFGASCHSCGQQVIAAIEQETSSRVATFNCPGCGGPVTAFLPAVSRPPSRPDDDEVGVEEDLARARVKARLRFRDFVR